MGFIELTFSSVAIKLSWNMTGQSSLVTYTKVFFAQPIVKARMHNKNDTKTKRHNNSSLNKKTMVLTWTSNSMKSIGNWAAELKERMEFSLMDFILLSDDCNMFIPLPLCPITTNLGHLNPHLVSTPSSCSFTPTHKTQNHSFHFISKLQAFDWFKFLTLRRPWSFDKG